MRKVDPVTGIITTFAGTGANGYGGDGEKAVDANFWAGGSFGATYPDSIGGLLVLPDGSLLIADCHRIRKVGLDGIITTFAGTGISGFSGDNGPATLAKFS